MTSIIGNSVIKIGRGGKQRIREKNNLLEEYGQGIASVQGRRPNTTYIQYMR